MRVLSSVALSALLLGVAGPAAAKPVTWKIDPSHSEMGFKVTHLVISKVRGEFQDFQGTVVLDDDNPENMKMFGTIDASSIDTGNDKRDNHLRSPDFFAAKKFPKIRFESTRFKKVKDGYEVFGKLTMRGVTKPIRLIMTGPSREVVDPGGNHHRAFSLEGTLNRKDWGLNWSKTIEGTGAVVGDEVDLEIEVELYGKKPGLPKKK